MTNPSPNTDPLVNLAQQLPQSMAAKVWEYAACDTSTVADIPGRVETSLQTPLDFPPISAAILPGDRVAVAVDPNIPQLSEVIGGVIAALSQTEAGHVDIVLWDEATEVTLRRVHDEFGDKANVTVHDSEARESLRYVGADAEADPIYLNRLLVDADFVLPLAAVRPLDRLQKADPTGIFPSLADSATRLRHWRSDTGRQNKTSGTEAEIVWLLGVQAMLAITVNTQGRIGQIQAGTTEAIAKELAPSVGAQNNFPPPAALVVAAIDSDHQQTWINAGRALVAACQYLDTDGGTIVLWSDIIDTPPPQALESNGADLDCEPLSDDGFPAWNQQSIVAQTIADIAAVHRVLVHSRCDSSAVEAIGLGVIESPDQLTRLLAGFDSCGILRAAPFAGSTAIKIGAGTIAESTRTHGFQK